MNDLLIKKRFVFFFLLLFLTNSFSQSSTNVNFYKSFEQKSNQDNSRTFSSDSKIFLNSVGSTLTSPFRWNNNDLITFGGLSVISGLSFLLDDEVRQISLKNQNEILNRIEPIGYNYGSPVFAFPTSVLFYLTGVIVEDDWIIDTGLMLTETIFLIGVIQVPIRIIFGRARPYNNEGNLSFKFLKGIGQDRASFISGHAAIAFGVSNILSNQINNPYATVALYALAATTPISRFYADKHWFSDVVIGTALGLVLSNSVINFHNDLENSQNTLSIYPSFNGVHFSYKLN
ncbi:MAG: phosphatase PAP2 family protein [Ignavibacteriales bacterium]|nr:phosphatase PAP2 family protein [Ignavibacteriales bacterium]